MLSKERRINYNLNPVVRGMIAFYFFISFFEPYINGTIGAITKYYIILLIGVILISTKGVVLRYYHYLYLIWFIYKLASIFWATNTYSFELHLVSHIGMVGLLMCITLVPIDGKTIDWCVKAQWLGSAIIGVLSLFFSKPHNGTNEARLVLTLFGVEGEPNNHAAFLLIGIAISLFFLLQEKKYKVLSLAVLFVNVYAVFMTASRSGLVGIVAVILISIFIKNRGEKITKKLIIVIPVAFAGILMLAMADELLSVETYDRLFKFSEYGDGSKRIFLWENTLMMIENIFDLLFGVGWGSYFGYNDVYKSVHNTFLSIMTDTGLLGLGIFIAPITVACWKMIKKRDMVSVGVFVAAMIAAFFMEAINKRFFWNGIIFILVVYNFHETNDTKPLVKRYKVNKQSKYQKDGKTEII